MVEPDGRKRIVVVFWITSCEDEVSIGCHDGNCHGSVFQRVCVKKCQFCRVLAKIDGQYKLVAADAIDSNDVAPLTWLVDDNGSFVENGTIRAIHRYRTNSRQKGECGVAHHDDAQLTTFVSGCQQIGVFSMQLVAYGAYTTIKGLVSENRLPLL